MNTQAIVTGAPGWLAGRFIEVLRNGMSEIPHLNRPSTRCIKALSLTPVSPNTADQIQWYTGDITQASSLQSIFADSQDATVFHCAGVIHPDKGIRQFYQVNYDGTRNLLDAACAGGVRRFIYVSSNSPVGVNSATGEIFDESSPCHPYMHYGKSKKLAEDLVNEYGSSGKLETVIIRPPWFYGPGQPARQTLFFSMIKQGGFPLVGNGLNLRSMAYIDNICQALLLAESQPQAVGQTYWVADKRPYEMQEIIATVRDVLESDFGIPVVRKQPRLPDLVSDLAMLADAGLQAVGLYQQKIHVLSEMNKNIACSIAKAERELGYAPQIELKEGTRRSIAWVLARGIKV